MVKKLNTGFTLDNCLFGSAKLTKNADPDKYKYSGYGVGFDLHSEFSLPDGSIGRNVIIFGAHMSSTVYVDDKNKDILNLSERPTQGLDDTTLTAEGKYPINFTKPNKRFELSLNSFLSANVTKKYHFKVKVSEMKYYVLCLDNISKDFTINSLKKEGLEGVNTNDTLGIHKYLMTRK